jgi:hypothetical protein
MKIIPYQTIMSRNTIITRLPELDYKQQRDEDGPDHQYYAIRDRAEKLHANGEYALAIEEYFKIYTYPQKTSSTGKTDPDNVTICW